MKSVTLFLVSVLVFAFTSPSLSTSILTVDDYLVLDDDGNPLEKDVGYTISPPIWGPLGGSVKLATISNNETCDVDVIQDPIEISNGTPFTFTPVNPSQESIPLGFPLAIQSPTVNPCGKSTVWQVISREGVAAQIITTGGSINTGPSCLRISKPEHQVFPNSYVIEHCPYMCDVVGEKICRTVGTYGSVSGGDYLWHLSTSRAPLQFVLTKNSESTAKKI